MDSSRALCLPWNTSSLGHGNQISKLFDGIIKSVKINWIPLPLAYKSSTQIRAKLRQFTKDEKLKNYGFNILPS